MTHAVFSNAQPIYAEHGIATFPVKESKEPAVRGYLRMGLDTSRGLVIKFPDAPAIGFATKRRNGVTILDIDTPDEKVLADALNRHGYTPLIARTASGKHHLYYRHNGERRRIRPWQGREIDLLGKGGMVIAPPSKLPRGEYEFIEGSLEDIPRLPVLRNLDLAKAEPIREGARNKQLWRHCMRHAHHVDTFDELLDVARTFNDDCLPPLEDAEVISAVQSAWKYTESGRNYFGQHAAWFPREEVNQLVSQCKTADQLDLLGLLLFLRANQGPDATFMFTNSLAEKFNVAPKRLAKVRRWLIEIGYIKCVRRAGRGCAALFRWAK
ncbi:MAG: bifunctional DNA primase/polymerase [Pseudolabrys sp.]